MSELSRIYDLEADIVGKEINGIMLLPIYHSTQKAQIDVAVFDDATFAYASEIDEEDSVTVIPVTEDSAARGNGIMPHPLCDKLIYVAEDYSAYVKGAKKNVAESFKAYIESLADWADSEYSDPLIRTICGYLKTGTLISDLIDSGVQVINLQDLVNGVDWIADRFRGKVCVELDIDRQLITPYGTPAQIDALIREEVEKISTPAGGLCMVYGWYPGVPLENARAVMDAMEKYAFFHA
jgi:hypothetical protein